MARVTFRVMEWTTLSRDKRHAAAPAATGAAIDVPLSGPYPPPGNVERSPTPGAVTAICDPMFENAAMNSRASTVLDGGRRTSAASIEPWGNVPSRPIALTAV